MLQYLYKTSQKFYEYFYDFYDWVVNNTEKL